MASPRKSKSARKSSPTKTAASLLRPTTTTTTTTTKASRHTKEEVKYVTRRNALPYVHAPKSGELKVAIVPPETFARLRRREEKERREEEDSKSVSGLIASTWRSILQNSFTRALLGRSGDDDANSKNFLLGRDCIRDLPFFSLTGEILFFSTHPRFLDHVFGFSFNEIVTLYNHTTLDVFQEGEEAQDKVHATVVGARGNVLWVVLEGDIVARPLPLPLLAPSLLPQAPLHTADDDGHIHSSSGVTSPTRTTTTEEQLVQYYHIKRLSREERSRVLAHNYFVKDNNNHDDSTSTSDFMRERENDALWAMWDMRAEGRPSPWRPQSRETTRYSTRTSRAATTVEKEETHVEENKVFVFTEKILRRLEREVEKRYPMEGPDRLQFLQRAPDLFIDIEEDDDEAPTSSPHLHRLNHNDSTENNQTNRLVLVPRIMPSTNTVGWSAEQTVAAAGGGLPFFRASLSASVVL